MEEIGGGRYKTPYSEFMKTEGIPIIDEFERARDLETAGPLKEWKRKGCRGAYISEKFGFLNSSAAEILDAYIAEITPRSETKVEKYLYEEIIYVVSGHGATSVWLGEEKKQTFEWQPGSLFALPLNTWHQHFNASNEPARFFGVTTAPGMINCFHNAEFVFSNPFAFRERFSGEEDFFNPEKGDIYAAISTGAKVWDCNLIPDVGNQVLFNWKERGAFGGNRMFQFGGNVLNAHVSEVPVGTYKKAHFHKDQGGMGGFLLIPKGTGYTLNWESTTTKWSEATAKRQIEWKANQLFIFDHEWFHQHFNTADTPSRYLVLYLASHRYPGFGFYKDRERVSIDISRGGRQVAYEDEDPEVMRIFEEELAKSGRKVKDPALWHHALAEEPAFEEGVVKTVKVSRT